MAASVLSRKFKSSKYATEEEKNRFQSEGENYIKDLWKKINNKIDQSSETPQSKSSCNSFFGQDFEEENQQGSTIEKKLNLLRLDNANTELRQFWLTRKITYPPSTFKNVENVMIS
jgi:hypothetical protein